MSFNKEYLISQQELLDHHRYTLMVYLKQLAKLGSAYAPPAHAHGIRESRENIRRIKEILRGQGISVIDLPDDEDNSRDPSRIFAEFGGDGKGSSQTSPVIKPIQAVTVAPIVAGVLKLRLDQNIRTKLWFLVAYNTSLHEVESISLTTTRMPAGVQLAPQQIHIPRARAGEHSIPVEVKLTIGTVATGAAIPVSVRYLSETGVWERHSTMFTLKLADEG